jgi:predicted AAA+ superfamily ATPase
MSNRMNHKNIPTIGRIIDLPHLLQKKSYFLFGPRQTGKTFLIHQTLKDARIYDLLDTSVYLALSQNPGRISQELTAQDKIVVIDEIQRLPILLNEVHRLIEESGTRFLLTGSSARKLRRGGVNLLGGRARTKYLHLFFRRSSSRPSSLYRIIPAARNSCRRPGSQYPGLQSFSQSGRVVQWNDRQLHEPFQ